MVCVECKSKPKRKNGLNVDGSQRYGKYCESCHKTAYNLRKGRNNRRYGYRRYKTNICSFCNFIAVDPCQLDVDHIDGNRLNNDPSNLQTLCANCHRLKTKLQRKNGS